MSDPMREKFEAWHNDFYGPQDQYNQIRSLRHFDEEIGLGYVDPVVQAQFCAFQGGQTTIAEQAKMIEHLRGGLTAPTIIDVANADADGYRNGFAAAIKSLPEQQHFANWAAYTEWRAAQIEAVGDLGGEVAP